MCITGPLRRFGLLELSSFHTWDEQEGDQDTGDQTAEVVKDADTGRGETPDQIEAQPEEPLEHGVPSESTQGAAIHDVEDA